MWCEGPDPLPPAHALRLSLSLGAMNLQDWGSAGVCVVLPWGLQSFALGGASSAPASGSERKHRQRNCRGVPGGISCSRLNRGGGQGRVPGWGARSNQEQMLVAFRSCKAHSSRTAELSVVLVTLCFRADLGFFGPVAKCALQESEASAD